MLLSRGISTPSRWMVWGNRHDTSGGLGTDEVGEPPEGDEKSDVVSTLPVLRVSCYLRVNVLLLCGVVEGQGAP